jgi:hypothetical protein
MDGRRKISGLKGSWEWLQFASQLPAKPVPLLAPSGNVVAFSGRCIYLGVNLVNSATTAGRVAVYDGLDVTGPLIDVAAVPASGVLPATRAAAGVLCELGVTVSLTSIVVTGSVLVVPLWHYFDGPPGE